MSTADELLDDIQKNFDKHVAEEIFDQYKQSGAKPSDAVVDAIATIFGKSGNEVRKAFNL